MAKFVTYCLFFILRVHLTRYHSCDSQFFMGSTKVTTLSGCSKYCQDTPKCSVFAYGNRYSESALTCSIWAQRCTKLKFDLGNIIVHAERASNFYENFYSKLYLQRLTEVSVLHLNFGSFLIKPPVPEENVLKESLNPISL